MIPHPSQKKSRPLNTAGIIIACPSQGKVELRALGSGKGGIVLEKRQRSPKGFLQESHFGSIRFVPGFRPQSRFKSKKSGDNSDRKNDPPVQRALNHRQ
ncbi:hypothetical protein VN24_02770 [Paenibacillus beijingensis]|uniref:Uncharacterized protein n=1 Tax=Paenibacillus beijingensis TaxID=1126833 RepID=A0A0D5NFJ8_9BACL|nr:hypothetical protein VN24_02770 [Paenibacillus beijingensis]